MDDRIDRLIELLEQINEEFPELSKVIINDPEEPDYIILTTQEYFQQMDDVMNIQDNTEEITKEKKKGKLH